MKYRPKSSIEFAEFETEFCSECFKEPGCTILAEAATFKVQHDEYPKELIYRNGSPFCTGFEKNTAA